MAGAYKYRPQYTQNQLGAEPPFEEEKKKPKKSKKAKIKKKKQ